MEIISSILIYIFFLVIGFGFQSMVRWSPWFNLALSYLIVLLLPPNWSLGLVNGSWIACAFFTYNPEQDNRFDTIPVISFRKTILASCWTFSGFLLTLLFLWKLKITNSLDLFPREILAWFFLILIELCLYRVIAKISPSLYRIPLGYGIAIINFLMILYWIYPLGISFMVLILLTLLIVNPILLLVIDSSLHTPQDSIFRRR